MLPRPEGDVIVPGAGSVELVFWGTLIGGTVAGLVTIVATTPRPPAPAVDGPAGTRGRPIRR
jgi:hypothetical protein